MVQNGFVKVMAVSPDVQVGNPKFNMDKVLEILNNKEYTKAEFILFPELNVSGYNIADLIYQEYLLNAVEVEIQRLLDNNPFDGVVIIGAPVRDNNIIYNCGIAIQKNKVLGIVPKLYLPHTNEFYETRWFSSGRDAVKKMSDIEFLGQHVPFGNIIFKNEHVNFAIEVCADMWAPITPATFLYLEGAEMVFNLSASNEYIGKEEARRQLVQAVSYRNNGAYIYCSSGVMESTSEGVFSGHKMVAENGVLIGEEQEFLTGDEFLFADVDVNKLRHKRRNNGWFKEAVNMFGRLNYQKVPYDITESDDYVFEKKLSRTPFIPQRDPQAVLKKAYMLQGSSLLKRLKYIGIEKSVIGISGGLDSTLALMAIYEAYKHSGIDMKNIIAVTMPGLATSKRTLDNAKTLMSKLGVTQMEIPIGEHAQNALSLIGHDGKTKNTTYENVQARVRTEVLMNLANEMNGLVIGTGDMSEAALGWATFNGDHMAMFGLNADIPKTLVRFLVQQYAVKYPELKEVLLDIVQTPISPELTNTTQATEDIIGKYEINDFILHRFTLCGDTEKRIQFLLCKVFDLSKEDSIQYTSNFYKRFFSQQYKRSTMPEGAKIVGISLSARSNFKMVGDMDYIK